MKIYILEVPPLVQPSTQPFAYPTHNKDYGIEQDFLLWLQRNPQLLSNNESEADWHYLPVFWTRWHIHHKFGEDEESLKLLQSEVDKVMIDDSKTFTITQFDGGTLLKIGKTIEFTGARTINKGIDIPILCSKHKQPLFPIAKKYIASFNGSFNTHPIREEMQKRYLNDKNVLVGGTLPTRFYIRWIQGYQYNLNTLASYVALCPRGTSCSSFRFYEAMQLGVAPCLIGDFDARPFKQFIDWDSISYYASTVDELDNLLSKLDKKEALQKGQNAAKAFKNELYYQKWCKYVIKELDAIK